VLTYQTDVLADDVTLSGNMWANLKVAISGTDADFVVKVIDVYPDSTKNTSFTTPKLQSNYQQMVRSEAMRGKYRNSTSKPEAFVPGKVTPVNFELQDIQHTFRKGHRLMVQVQSTWFPLIDRNPQQFINIMKAKPADFKKETVKVYEGSEGSFLKVRVM
ncbi:MAG: CocE/NonD family hydrolase, partial [Sphingobacteriaceae bacterium]